MTEITDVTAVTTVVVTGASDEAAPVSRNPTHRIVPLAVSMIVGAAVAVVGLAVIYAVWGPVTKPLPDAFSLPDQVVVSHLPSYPHSPAQFTNKGLVVLGTKCNLTNETTRSHGLITWQSLSPPGTVITLPNAGSATFVPHECKHSIFYNLIPAQVAAANVTLTSFNHGSSVVWRLSGSMISDGHATQVWNTQPFVLLNPGQTP